MQRVPLEAYTRKFTVTDFLTVCRQPRPWPNESGTHARFRADTSLTSLWSACPELRLVAKCASLTCAALRRCTTSSTLNIPRVLLRAYDRCAPPRCFRNARRGRCAMTSRRRLHASAAWQSICKVVATPSLSTFCVRRCDFLPCRVSSPCRVGSLFASDRPSQMPEARHVGTLRHRPRCRLLFGFFGGERRLLPGLLGETVVMPWWLCPLISEYSACCCCSELSDYIDLSSHSLSHRGGSRSPLCPGEPAATGSSRCLMNDDNWESFISLDRPGIVGSPLAFAGAYFAL